MNRHSGNAKKQVLDLPKGVDLFDKSDELAVSKKEKSNSPSLVDADVSKGSHKLASQEFKAGQLKNTLANVSAQDMNHQRLEND